MTCPPLVFDRRLDRQEVLRAGGGRDRPYEGCPEGAPVRGPQEGARMSRGTSTVHVMAMASWQKAWLQGGPPRTTVAARRTTGECRPPG